MSDGFKRYAVYWVPKRADPLARFGMSWTGWCADQGELRQTAEFGGLSFSVDQVTRNLRRHGLHAVIRAPFSMAQGRSRFTLETALENTISGMVAPRMPKFDLAVIGGRVALVPRTACPVLGQVVDRIGLAVDSIAAPEADPARLRAAEPAMIGSGGVVQLPLTGANRFHIPLTDRMDVNDAFRAADEIRPLVAAMLDGPRHLHDVALVGDPGGGRRLRVLTRYDLHLTPPRRATDVLPVQGRDMLVPTHRTEIAV